MAMPSIMPPIRTLPSRRYKPASRPLADLVLPCIGPALAKQGFGEADILMHWSAIVGDDLAERCQPLKLQWPARRPTEAASTFGPATLLVRVEGGFAIRLQHVGAVVIERVNAHLGWRCVGRLALRQGPLTRLPAPPPRSRPPTPTEVAEASERLHGIGDEGLRAALARLGAASRVRRIATRPVQK